MRPSLEQVREDLAVLRATAGLDPVWNPDAIRTHLLLAGAAVVAAIWAVFPHGLWEVAGMAAFLVPVIDWWWRARGRPNRTSTDDREWREALAVLWYALPLAVLAWWSRVAGLSLVTMAGLMCFMLGLVLYGSAVSERRMRPLFGWAVAFMVCGLVTPLHVDSLVPITALAIGFGAITSAAWIAVDRNRANAV